MSTADLVRTKLELLQEQMRRQCRRSFGAFCIQALSPLAEIPARHHQRLIAELEAVARTDSPRLMVLMPPGSGKTTYTSRLFVAWYMATHPNSSIIGASHTQEFAETNSSFLQRIVRENSDTLGYTLTSEAIGHWTTSNGCRYRALGARTAAPGYRADLVVADDVVKGREDAESPTAREHLWDWWTADVLPRLKPQGVVVMIGTRYHEDDIMGRLERADGQQWRILKLPAIAEDNDPLGRQEGEPLWDDDTYGYGKRLLEIRDTYERQGLTRDWFSLYQGSPRAPEGNLFKIARMPIYDILPGTVIQQCRAWDLASSLKGDFTVGVQLAAVQLTGTDITHWIITDIWRGREPPERVRATVKLLAEADGFGTPIYLPEDPGQAGQSQIVDYVNHLAGYRVTPIRMTGSKEQRAMLLATRCNIGQVGMLRAPWNGALLDELQSFPNGRNDDQVDALSLAFDQLGLHPPMNISREALLDLGIDFDAPYRPSLGYYARPRVHF